MITTPPRISTEYITLRLHDIETFIFIRIRKIRDFAKLFAACKFVTSAKNMFFWLLIYTTGQFYSKMIQIRTVFYFLYARIIQIEKNKTKMRKQHRNDEDTAQNRA